MDAVGRLTTSGLLYEGKLDEWIERMDAVLQELGIDGPVKPKEPRSDSLFLKNSDLDAQAKSLLQWSMSPQVLRSIPENAWTGRRHLVRALHYRANAFKLMELPAEVRKIIFEYAVEDNHHKIEALNFEETVCRLPPLTRTSRQLRVETLSLAWSAINLYVFVTRDMPLNYLLDLTFYRTELPMVGFEFLRRVTVILAPVLPAGRKRIEKTRPEKLLVCLQYNNETKTLGMDMRIDARSPLKLKKTSQESLDILLDNAITLMNTFEQSSCNALLTVLTTLLAHEPQMWDNLTVEPLE